MTTAAERWTEVIETIKERDGTSEEEANTNLVNLLNSPEVLSQIAKQETTADVEVGHASVTLLEAVKRIEALEVAVAACVRPHAPDRS